MKAAFLALLVGITAGATAQRACLDLSKSEPITLAGTLTLKIFGGAPASRKATRRSRPIS